MDKKDMKSQNLLQSWLIFQLFLKKLAGTPPSRLILEPGKKIQHFFCTWQQIFFTEFSNTIYKKVFGKKQTLKKSKTAELRPFSEKT